jgi:hypothetical protein
MTLSLMFAVVTLTAGPIQLSGTARVYCEYSIVKGDTLVRPRRVTGRESPDNRG